MARQQAPYGVADLQGSTSGTLAVGDMVRKRPTAYSCKCSQCGASSIESQDHLLKRIGCRASSCGIDPNRTAANEKAETLSQYQRRTRPDELRAAALKRKHNEDEQQAQQTAELEAEYKKLTGEVSAATRKNVLNGVDPDIAEVVDRATIGVTMTQGAACAFNAAESEKFVNQTPAYYPCTANWETIKSYLIRNQIQIQSCKTFKAVFERLDSAGLMTHRPKPAPPTPKPVRPKPAVIEPPKPEPGTLDGFDPSTGEKRLYTRWEVEHMSALDFKRASRMRPEDGILKMQRYW